MRIYTGVEANIMDFKGNLDLDEAVLKKMDYVIASLHMPCIKPGTPKGEYGRPDRGYGESLREDHRPPGRRPLSSGV